LQVTGLGDESGIAKAKMVLNALHAEMALQGYEEGHVHQENDVSCPIVYAEVDLIRFA
jgi:glycogen debranching enzyme